MSIIDIERNTGFAPSPQEHIGDQVERGNGLSFAEAAELSRGPYDTDEQHAERIEMARRLQETMLPGASVLHQVSRLEVRGGLLVDAPGITLVPTGTEYELALTYQTETQDGELYTGAMLFRNLAYGTRYGARQHIPELIAGQDDIRHYVLAKYQDQREREAHGLSWDDITPLTELHRLSALAQTDVRMSDVLPAQETAALRERLTADLVDSPDDKHLRGVLRAALEGVDDTAPEHNQDQLAWRQADNERAEKRAKRHARVRRLVGRTAALLTRI